MTGESASDFDIAVVGRGVREVEHLTLEALAVLKSCKRGFVSALTQDEVDTLRNSVLNHLKSAEPFPPLSSLSVAYRSDRPRTDDYADAGEVVLDAAASESPVAYLPQGNPLIWDAVTQRILEGARARGFRTKVVPGISFIDTMVVDLERDVAPGIQIYDASWALAAEIHLDTRAACILGQVGQFRNRHPLTETMPQATAMEALRDYLLRYYPCEHPIVLVRSQTAGSGQPFVRPLTLSELAAAPEDHQLWPSIYIPPVVGPALGEDIAARVPWLATVAKP